MQIRLAFMLATAAAAVQTINLIGAPVKANTDQKGKVLTDKKFLSVEGEEVTVTEPEGHANVVPIEEIQAFLQLGGGRVIGAEVTSQNTFQASSNFIEETYLPIDPTVNRKFIGANMSVIPGEGTVRFEYTEPFIAAANKSLLMALHPGAGVMVQLVIELTPINQVSRVVS